VFPSLKKIMFRTGRQAAAKIVLFKEKVNNPRTLVDPVIRRAVVSCWTNYAVVVASPCRTIGTTIASTDMASSVTSHSPPQVSKQQTIDLTDTPIQKEANIICVGQPNDKANLDLYKLTKERKDGVQVVKIGSTMESFSDLQHIREKINVLFVSSTPNARTIVSYLLKKIPTIEWVHARSSDGIDFIAGSDLSTWAATTMPGNTRHVVTHARGGCNFFLEKNLPRFVRQYKLLNPVHPVTPAHTKAPRDRRGRGRGRGDGSSDYGRGGSSRRPCRIQTTDFAAIVRDSQAYRFKVHLPGCKCGKVKRIVWPTHGPPMDAFWVLKDTSSTDAIFCGGSAASYKTDPLTCEETLRDVVFANDQAPPFKISCALCMLQDHPNGFVCITADVAKVVDRARDMARRERTLKLERGQALHSDHAHSMCTVSISALKNRVKNSHLLMEELQKQGVEGLSVHTKFKLGHHLKVILESLEHKYIFVMVFDDKTSISLDLPGGKRQLGEESWDCAVRETEEETSLKIDKNWLVGTPRIDECNLFYMAQPPGEKDPQELAESLAALTLGATTNDP